MLCYEVDLQKYKDKNKIKEQLKTGLILLLDYNVERQSEMYNPKKVNKLDSDKNENDVQIYLDTISKLHFKELTIIYLMFNDNFHGKIQWLYQERENIIWIF